MQITRFPFSRTAIAALSYCAIAVIQGLLPPSADAQVTSPTYRTFAKTFYREAPVTEYRWEEKEVMETSTKRKYVPVYQTETLEKKTISYRPVQKTSERVERTRELQPVTVTKYHEREIRETSYDTVTEMREEQYIKQRPVTETVMQDRAVNVKKKITENSLPPQRSDRTQTFGGRIKSRPPPTALLSPLPPPTARE